MIQIFIQRKEKIDLGVGVYKDNKGQTPIMSAVKQASNILNNKQTSKSYVGLLGNLGFIDKISNLVLADAVPQNRIVGSQAPGGTSAFHQLLLLIRSMGKDQKVWISSPSWPNHEAIIKHLGIKFDNDLYKLFRRIVMLSFIIFELIAQAYLIKFFFEIKNNLEKYINIFYLKIKRILIITLITASIIILPFLPFDNLKFLKHALEWDYFIGVISFYLLTFFMWKKTIN